MTLAFESMRTRLACTLLAIICIWNVHWSMLIVHRELRRRHGALWISKRFPALSHRALLTSDLHLLAHATRPSLTLNLEWKRSRLSLIQHWLKQDVANKQRRKKCFPIRTLAGRRLASAALQKLGSKIGLAGPVSMLCEDQHTTTCLAQHLVSYLDAIGLGKPSREWLGARTLLLERSVAARSIDLDAIRDEFQLQMIRTLAVPKAYLEATRRNSQFATKKKVDVTGASRSTNLEQ